MRRPGSLALIPSFSLGLAFAQASLSVSVLGVEKAENNWRIVLALSNNSPTELSLRLSPSLADGAGRLYPARPVEAAPSTDQSASYPMLLGSGVSLTSDLGEIKQPAGEPGRLVAILPLEFRLPAGAAARRLVLGSHWDLDLSGVPAPPLLAPPAIGVGSLPPGLAVSLHRAARALGRISATGKTETGLLAALKAADPQGAARIVVTAVTDFTARSSDIWVVTAATFRNLSRTSIAVPLEKVLLKEPGSGQRQSWAPVGVVSKGECRLGDPLRETVPLAAGETVALSLIYRPDRWWLTEYTLALR